MCELIRMGPHLNTTSERTNAIGKKKRVGLASCPKLAAVLVAVFVLSSLYSGSRSHVLAAEVTGEVHQLEEVVVTATGHETESLNTSHAITIMNEDEIAKSVADNVGDLLRGQPGIAVAGDGAWGMNPVLRGLKKEQVVILVDGVRLSSAQPYGAISSLVNLDQVQRVEVVKGPASVLYGSGAMGGVVNFITRKTGFTDQAKVSGSVSFGGSNADEAFRGGMNLGFSNQDHALNLSFSAMNVGDYESPEGMVEHTGYEQQSVAANYRLRISESGSIELTFQQQKDEDVWYPGSEKPNPAHGSLIIHSPEQKRSLYHVSYGTDFSNESLAHLTVNAYFQDVDRTIHAFSDNLQRDVVRTDVQFETFGGGVGFDFEPIKKHLFSVGVDGWETKGDPSRFMDLNPPAFDSNTRRDPFEQGLLQSMGVFLQDELLLDKWVIKAGARFDHIVGDADAAAGLPPGTELKHTDNTVSWSLGAVRNISRAVNPYVNLARAYRAADMRERFESSPRGDGYLHQGNPALDPELNTTVELGVKGTTGRVSYTLAAYYSRVGDYIIGRDTGMIDPGTGLPIKHTENLAEVDLAGVEVSVVHDLGGNYSAFSNFSYLYAENKYDDEPMAEIPPMEMSFGLRRVARPGWNWDVVARFVAKQDRIGTKLTNGKENTTEGFVTADAGVGYRFNFAGGKYGNNLRLSVTNIFDEAYHEHLSMGISGMEPMAMGRNVHLTWKGEF